MFVAAIATFICRRPVIAYGIITVVLASPLLLVGSCFVAFAGLDI
jgi:hypothetical protein